MPKIQAVILFLAICLTGCLATKVKSELSNQIQVFGIQMYANTDYREINGVKGVEEPCLRGYERVFDQLDIIIGYGFNRKIRKITTLNRETSLFGIIPGIPANAARHLARQAGFSEVSPDRYRYDDMSLFLIINDNGNVTGITLEESVD